MVSDRIAKIRERLNRREKKVRADRQARSRRIDRDEPEGAREQAAVKVRKAKKETEQSAGEARQLAADAKTLVATELGVSTNEAESVIEQGASLLEGANEKLGSLDGDGDGDTDLMTALDQPLTDGDGRQGRGNNSSGGGSSADKLFDPFDGSGSAEDVIFDPFEDGPQ